VRFIGGKSPDIEIDLEFLSTHERTLIERNTNLVANGVVG